MKQKFSNARAAKDFLAGKVAAQALIENIPFTKAEKELMYYSVDDPSSQESSRDVSDDTQFEEKISGLIRRAWENDSERTSYEDAFKKLSEGDHYLSAMDPFTGGGFVSTSANSDSTPLQKSGPLFLTAVAVVVAMLLIATYWQPTKEALWHWLHQTAAK